MVRPDFRVRIPIVIHFYGSGRLQTIQPDHNPYFYSVIIEFDKIRGIPVVLNTSFNINAEPIALSPDNAVSTFFNSGSGYLMTEDSGFNDKAAVKMLPAGLEDELSGLRN